MNFYYCEMLIAIVFSYFLALGLLYLMLSIIDSEEEREKSSAYECGFHPYQDTRQKFNVRYYLVSIIFMIFDLEVIYFFPWVYEDYSFLTIEAYVFVLSFLAMLIVGFCYEWLKGTLTWE